jgi:hypothetical protein
MPYQPFDTGWIKSAYSLTCLGWFLFSTGLLPRFTLYSFYNNIYIPFSKMIIFMCESMGNVCLTCSKQIISCEDTLFNKFNYIDPIYNIINYVVNSFPILDGGRPPSFNYYPSNIRLRKTSSGRHLASYFARKRIRRKQQIISGPTKENDNNSKNTNENRKHQIPHDRNYGYNNYTF